MVSEWSQVPAAVAARVQDATTVIDCLRRKCSHVGFVDWDPETDELTPVSGSPSTDRIRLKIANQSLPWVTAPYRWAGKPFGGPNALTNGVVTSLLGAGLGYGAGTLAENLLPERYFDRGRLRRTLAIAGALPGLGVTGLQAWGSQGPLHRAGRGGLWNSLTTPVSKLPVTAEDALWLQHIADTRPKFGSATGVFERTRGLPAVPVDAFNQAIWNDVAAGANSNRYNPFGTRSQFGSNDEPLHTPPQVGAAASGLVTGIQQLHGGASLLDPRHFISGLAAAGLDAATARFAGGVLGALGGLKPEAQKKLQSAGIWSGLIRGVTGSVLGLY